MCAIVTKPDKVRKTDKHGYIILRKSSLDTFRTRSTAGSMELNKIIKSLSSKPLKEEETLVRIGRFHIHSNLKNANLFFKDFTDNVYVGDGQPLYSTYIVKCTIPKGSIVAVGYNDHCSEHTNGNLILLSDTIVLNKVIKEKIGKYEFQDSPY